LKICIPVGAKSYFGLQFAIRLLQIKVVLQIENASSFIVKVFVVDSFSHKTTLVPTR